MESRPTILPVSPAQAAIIVPVVVAERIGEFLATQKYGTITLEVKAGRIVEYKITEAGRV